MLGGKKQGLALGRNGKELLQIKTLHGSFTFACQRFCVAGSSAGHYLDRSGQGTVSQSLLELCLYYSGRMSFGEVAGLIERLTGERMLCPQTLCNWARHKAQSIEQTLWAEVEAAHNSAGGRPLVTIAEHPDIYDGAAREVLVMSDAIGVKAQRPTRESAGRPRPEKPLKRISTDLMLIEETSPR